jgi:hypothetical protein
MGLYVLKPGLAVPEGVRPGPQFGGSFLVATGRSAVGPQQRETVRMVQEVELAVYVPPEIGIRGLLGTPYELGQLVVDDGVVHRTSLTMARPPGREATATGDLGSAATDLTCGLAARPAAQRGHAPPAGACAGP